MNDWINPRTLHSLVIPVVAGLSLWYALAPANGPKKTKIHKGIEGAPDGKWKSRLLEIYPPDFHGEGRSVKLPYGRTKYWLLGPENGKKVVLLHGLLVPSYNLAPLAKILADNGFRVLLYDMYGRGYSDAPETTYDTNLYVTQLALLLQAIGWQKASLVGMALGGAVAAAFAAKFPYLVDDNIAFIATAGLMTAVDFPTIFSILTSPLGELVSKYIVRSNLRRHAHHEPGAPVVAPSPVDNLPALIGLQAGLLPGFVPAFVSTIKDGPVRGEEDSFKVLGSRVVRVLLIWGTEDKIMTPRFIDNLKDCMPQAEVFMIKGAGHDINLTHPKEVGAALVKHLKG